MYQVDITASKENGDNDGISSVNSTLTPSISH